MTWEEEFELLPQELQDIAMCESGLNINIKNPYSSASGLFQFIDGTFAWTWKEVYGTDVDWSLKNDPYVQIELAEWLYQQYGNSHWECATLGLI